MTYIKDLFFDLHFLALFSAVAAFILSTKFHLYPVIIHVSKKKSLMDEPGERSMHKTQVPTLGGLGIFITFSLSIIIFGLLANLIQTDLIKLLSLIGSAIILIFLGVKDDLVLISPKKKFIGQLIAAINVIVLSDVRITSFEGLLGIGGLPYIVSVLFSVFVFILVINAFNLIDGIDGLAGAIGVISSISFGVFFLLNGFYMMTLISFVLIGSIIGFLKYNLSSTQKIFMGDCGSMFAGFLLAYQGINFLALNQLVTSSNTISNAPIVLLAILSYPLLDTLRVFTIRIRQKRSPFTADRNHIHHRLLNLGLNHKQAALLLSICNVLVIGLAFLIGDLNIHVQLFIIVFVGLLLYLSPFLKVFGKNINLNAVKSGGDPILTKQDVKTNNVLEQSIQNIMFTKKQSSSNQLPFSSNIQEEQTSRGNDISHKSSQDDEKNLKDSKNTQKQKILNKRLAAFKKLVKKEQ